MPVKSTSLITQSIQKQLQQNSQNSSTSISLVGKEPTQQVSQKSSTNSISFPKILHLKHNYAGTSSTSYSKFYRPKTQVGQIQQVPMDSPTVGIEVVNDQIQKEPRGFPL